MGSSELLVGISRIDTLNAGDLGRIGKEVDDSVEESLDSDVLESRSAEGGAAFPSECSLADGRDDFIGGDGGLVLEILLGQVVVEIGSLFDHLVSPELGHVLHVLGNVPLVDDGAHLGLVEVVGLHLEEVDQTFEFIAGADWDLYGDWIGEEPLANGVEAELEVAPILSILLMKHRRGTSYRSA